jgi:nitroreductase
MKRDQKGAKRRRRQIRVWTLEQARAALPYLSSVMRSLREHRLEAVTQHRSAERLANRPGRPDRDALIAQTEATQAAEQADERFHEALAELRALDIHLLDPIAGQALIPFAHDENLAWYVYDAFDPQPLRFWRYHSDSLETRRPIAEIEADPQGRTWLA